MAEFFSMGGYGAFVWPSFGISLLVLAVLLLASIRFARTSASELKELEDEIPDNPRRSRS